LEWKGKKQNLLRYLKYAVQYESDSKEQKSSTRRKDTTSTDHGKEHAGPVQWGKLAAKEENLVV
jgi:hypothetical protein